jgi:hypothetical protein
MACGNEGGENVRFKHKKVFVLNLKIHICWSNVSTLPRSIVKF